jgi:hypothetical protein
MKSLLFYHLKNVCEKNVVRLYLASKEKVFVHIAIVDSLFTRSQGRSDLIILSDANRSPQLVPNCPA